MTREQLVEPRIIYADRVAGDLYALTFSYHGGSDNEVSLIYVERLARRDGARVRINNGAFGSDWPSIDPEYVACTR
jgi:hypothetical protein